MLWNFKFILMINTQLYQLLLPLKYSNVHVQWKRNALILCMPYMISRQLCLLCVFVFYSRREIEYISEYKELRQCDK